VRVSFVLKIFKFESNDVKFMIVRNVFSVNFVIFFSWGNNRKNIFEKLSPVKVILRKCSS